MCVCVCDGGQCANKKARQAKFPTCKVRTWPCQAKELLLMHSHVMGVIPDAATCVSKVPCTEKGVCEPEISSVLQSVDWMLTWPSCMDATKTPPPSLAKTTLSHFCDLLSSIAKLLHDDDPSFLHDDPSSF